MKKVISVIMVIALVFSLSSCGSQRFKEPTVNEFVKRFNKAAESSKYSTTINKKNISTKSLSDEKSISTYSFGSGISLKMESTSKNNRVSTATITAVTKNLNDKNLGTLKEIMYCFVCAYNKSTQIDDAKAIVKEMGLEKVSDFKNMDTKVVKKDVVSYTKSNLLSIMFFFYEKEETETASSTAAGQTTAVPQRTTAAKQK